MRHPKLFPLTFTQSSHPATTGGRGSCRAAVNDRAHGTLSRWSRLAGRLALELAVGVTVTIGCLTAAGCAQKQQGAKGTLNEGYGALTENRLDQAQAAADRVLAEGQTAKGAPDALYLRGRVFEERARGAEGNPQQVIALLNEARSCYVRALALHPETKLDASIRAQLANVAYFQEDFATAADQWSAAYPNLATPNDKAWALYRAGLSRQRLGKFQDADAAFAAVQQQFPGTDPAKRAAQRQGARAFHVQVGTFADTANASKLIAQLRSQGYAPLKSTEPGGKQIIAVGPVGTYEQAKALQARLALQYPGTVILP